MRILWTLLKVIVALAIAIPLAFLALGAALGIVGVAIGLAIVALKLAILAFVGYGAYRLARHLFWPAPAPKTAPALPDAERSTDRYYDAAMRELDAELRTNPHA